MNGVVRYPWKKWFTRKQVTLTRGVDYHCMTHSMSVQVRNAALQRGLKVSVSIGEDELTIRRK